MLAGVGSNQRLSPNSTMPNYCVVTENTPHEEIEAHYKALVQSNLVQVIFINKSIADKIRNAINQLREITNGNGCIGLPAVVELPPRNS